MKMLALLLICMAISADRSAQGVRIVAMGDSTTAGTPAFASPVEMPPAGKGDPTSQYTYWLMQSHPEWEVLNRGVNGERSDQIRARFERDVVAARPVLVVVIAGVNDVYQGRPVDVGHRPSPMDVRQGPEIRHSSGRWYNPSLRHRDAGTEPQDASDQRLDPATGGSRPDPRLRRYAVCRCSAREAGHAVRNW